MTDDIFMHEVYHGSRGGIKGRISPYSKRQYMDFGPGFYMGTYEMQTKALVCNDDPVFYTFRFDTERLSTRNILYLDGEAWLYTVLACLDREHRFPELSAFRQALNQYDIVYGAFADDARRAAIREFADGNITDLCLYEALRAVPFGTQINVRTEEGCECIVEQRHYEPGEDELTAVAEFSSAFRTMGKQALRNMKIKYRREGRYIEELLSDREHIQSLVPTGDNHGHDIGSI